VVDTKKLVASIEQKIILERLAEQSKILRCYTGKKSKIDTDFEL